MYTQFNYYTQAEQRISLNISNMPTKQTDTRYFNFFLLLLLYILV